MSEQKKTKLESSLDSIDNIEVIEDLGAASIYSGGAKAFTDLTTENGSVTSQALGEEGGSATSQALGEEGGSATTAALGEEGGSVTSQALGEEGGMGSMSFWQ